MELETSNNLISSVTTAQEHIATLEGKRVKMVSKLESRDHLINELENVIHELTE
jgi:hypothetical protein